MAHRAQPESSNCVPEFLDFREITLEDGLEAIKSGTHTGTAILNSRSVKNAFKHPYDLFIAPHYKGEVVNPHAVHYGAVVQFLSVNPILSGEHFQDAQSLQAWIDEGHGIHTTYITDSYNASQPPPTSRYPE